MGVRRHPSYGFDLAGTAFGVRPEEGVSRSMLAQLFPELDLKTTSVKDTQAEEVEKPEEAESKVKQGTLLNIEEDDNIPGSALEKFGVKGSLSYAAPINVQVGPTGPQGRGSRLGYTGATQQAQTMEQGEPEPSISNLLEEQKNVMANLQSNLNAIASNFDYSKYGESGFGLKDVEALRAQGVDESTLKTLASNAPMVGPGAAQQLGYAPTQQQRTESIARSYDPGSAGGAGFGLKDVESLRSQGVSAAQMREIARRSPTIGEGARQLLGL